MHEATQRWLTGWSTMRGLHVTEQDGWPLVHVRTASRRSELVCDDVDPAELELLLATLAGDPAAMLTAIGPTVDHLRHVPTARPARLDRDDETLMVLHHPTAIASSPPDGLVGTWDESSALIRYSVEDRDSVVAEGCVGLVDGWATIDAVETSPSHRRRGLGRHVVARLTGRALELGATRGVLVASADGRPLYESMGWRVERHLLSWMGA